MGMNRGFFFCHPFLEYPIHKFLNRRTLLVLVLALAFLTSCVEKRMSLKETAKHLKG